MPCTEAYKEHIEYTFNAFCRVVIHYAAINAWRDRDKRRQREISFEYLTEEKFYPFCTSDTYFIDPYKQYPVTICGQRVILTNGNLAEALYLTEEKFYPFCTSDTYFIQHQFRTSLFLRWEKLRCTQQAKAHKSSRRNFS